MQKSSVLPVAEHFELSNLGEAEMIIWYSEVNIYFIHAAGRIVEVLFTDGCMPLIFGYEGPFRLFDCSLVHYRR